MYTLGWDPILRVGQIICHPWSGRNGTAADSAGCGEQPSDPLTACSLGSVYSTGPLGGDDTTVLASSAPPRIFNCTAPTAHAPWSAAGTAGACTNGHASNPTSLSGTSELNRCVTGESCMQLLNAALAISCKEGSSLAGTLKHSVSPLSPVNGRYPNDGSKCASMLPKHAEGISATSALRKVTHTLTRPKLVSPSGSCEDSKDSQAVGDQLGAEE